MKKIIAVLLVWMLVKPIAVQAGIWAQYQGENDRYQDDNGNYISDQWKQIDGKWYYFNSYGLVKDAWVGDYYVDSDGAMLTNAVTPDGYQVGDDGFCLGKEKAEIKSNNLTAFKTLLRDELNEIFNAKCGFERVFIMDYKNTDMTADEKARIMNPCYELLLFSRKEDMRCKYLKDVLTDGELYIYREQDVVDIMQDLFGVQTTQEDLLALQANANKVEGDSTIETGSIPVRTGILHWNISSFAPWQISDRSIDASNSTAWFRIWLILPIEICFPKLFSRTCWIPSSEAKPSSARKTTIFS